jgi:23S rRNA pseudouridine1911/1915/1917 synthase
VAFRQAEARRRAAVTALSFAVPGALAGERVDRVLALLMSCSRAEAARLVAAGAVRVAGRSVTQGSARLAAGEQLEVDRRPAPPPPPVPEPAAAGELRIVYADDDLVVLDKPAGVVVHPGAGRERGTLVSQLLAAFPELATTPGVGDRSRPGIVHRLDKETSGLLAVARSPLAYQSLVAQLAARTMGRRYRALVLGHLDASSGLVEAPIGRSRRDPTRMAVVGGGREARTFYEVRACFLEPVAASELTVRLESGRTHQIRVHLAAIGHPVAGDRRYGGARRLSGLDRPFLHAEHLELTHPRDGRRCRFDSPLAPELAEALSRYR